MKRAKIGVGSLVRIVDPRPILQLDYDNTMGTILATLDDRPDINAFCRALNLDDISTGRVLRAVAASHLKTFKTNGAQRRLLLGEVREDLRNAEVVVLERCVRCTGQYDRGYGPTHSYSGFEDDGEPPYLAVDRRHECLLVQGNEWVFSLPRPKCTWPYDGLWFLREHVEPISWEHQ